MTKFEELAQVIENSLLISYVFENKQLRFQLFHLDSSRLYSFSMPSDTVHGRSVSGDRLRSTCSIRLIDLRKRLETRYDRYFPPADSRQILCDARDRVTLAYGRRCVEHRWLINLQGDYPLLTCLVRELDEIEWEVE
jgi:hypothetical protein